MSRHRFRAVMVFIISVLSVVAAALKIQQRASNPPRTSGQQRPRAEQKVWERLDGCKLVPNGNNDGDSFLVSHKDGAHIFRLYFVDCPETHAHQYNRERIAAQGRYFGNLSEGDVTALGGTAQEFTRTVLDRERFTVWTHWTPVYDSERRYALVRLSDGSDLGEQLVQRGLARIHTTGADLPDGKSLRAAQADLRRTELAAKRAGRGGWAAP